MAKTANQLKKEAADLKKQKAVADAEPKTPVVKKKLGHNLRHKTARNSIVLVPIMSKPMGIAAGGTSDSICPTCQVFHPVKTLHIWTGPNGEVTLGSGILETLKKNGMEDFIQGDSTDKPPPLIIGAGVGRAGQDYANRSQVIYKEP